MRFYLFRHGRSLANENKLVTGTPSDQLSADGLSQARHMMHWVSESKIKADYYTVSQWRRAQQTAMCIYPEADWYEDPRLGETIAGDVSNIPLQQFLCQVPSFYQNPANCYPNGESHLDLQKRVIGWVRDLLTKPYSQIVAVTHAGPIACILHEVLHIPMSYFPAIVPINASLTIVDAELDGDKINGRLIGVSLGAVENLREYLSKDK